MQESLLVFISELKSMLWLTWVSINIVNIWKLCLFWFSLSLEVFYRNPFFLIFKILLPYLLNFRANIRRRYINAWLVQGLLRQTIKIFYSAIKPLLWLYFNWSSFLKILFIFYIILNNWYFSIVMIQISKIGIGFNKQVSISCFYIRCSIIFTKLI